MDTSAAAAAAGAGEGASPRRPAPTGLGGGGMTTPPNTGFSLREPKPIMRPMELRLMVEAAVEPLYEELKPIKASMDKLMNLVGKTTMLIQRIDEKTEPLPALYKQTRQMYELMPQIKEAFGQEGPMAKHIEELATEKHKLYLRNMQIQGMLSSARKKLKALEAERLMLRNQSRRGGGEPPAFPPSRVDRKQAEEDSDEDEEDAEEEDAEEGEEDEVEEDEEDLEPPSGKRARSPPVAAAAAASSSSSSSAFVPRYAKIAEKAERAVDAMDEIRANTKFCTVCHEIFDTVSEAVKHYDSEEHAAEALKAKKK